MFKIFMDNLMYDIQIKPTRNNGVTALMRRVAVAALQWMKNRQDTMEGRAICNPSPAANPLALDWVF